MRTASPRESHRHLARSDAFRGVAFFFLAATLAGRGGR